MRSTCRQCGNYYETKRSDSVYCSDTCRKAFSRRPPKETGYTSVSGDDINAIFNGTLTPKDLTFNAAPPTNQWVPSKKGSIVKEFQSYSYPKSVPGTKKNDHDVDKARYAISSFRTETKKCKNGHIYSSFKCTQKECL